MLQVNAHTLESLVSAKNYREFLERAFEKAAPKHSRFTYAGFARKAGFRARSFPRDVVLGKKHLTYESASSFATALGLTGDLRSYFLGLVAQETPEKLSKLRKRLKSKMTEMGAGKRQGGFPFQMWLEIYAALGTMEKGATFQEILLRTRLPEKRVEAALAEMKRRDFVDYNEKSKRYLATHPHLIFKDQGKDQAFKQWFIDTLLLARRRALSRFDSEDALFFNSVFSVSHHNMPQLKKELRELILRYIDSAEDPEGDCLARVNVALFL